MATNKNQSKIISVLNVLLIVLVLFSLIADGLFIYYKFFNKDITIGVYYWGEQLAVDSKNVNELTESEIEDYEARTVITVNLYSNDKENGIELQEMMLNYFTDYELQESSYRSSGMQYVGNYIKEAIFQESPYNANQFVSNAFTYYDTALGISMNGYNGNYGSVNTRLDRNEQLIININNEAYAIQLNKVYEDKTRILFWDKVNSRTYYNYTHLFACVMQAVKSNSRGYGDWYTVFDLSKFFTIRKFDKDSGKFLADDVTNVIKNYALVKFHYDENGATQATQSLFGSIQNDNSYGLSDEEKNVEYWSENIIQSIDINNLALRYSEVNNGYFASLSTSIKNKLKQDNKAKLDITIDLTKSDKRIIGLDYDAFKDVNIRTLNIIGSGEFILNSGSLINTNLRTLEHSTNITLIINSNATNNTYTEVVI